MRTFAAVAAFVGLTCGSAALASPEQPASMKPIAKAGDGYSPEVRAVMEDQVALATGRPRAAVAAEAFGAPASDLVAVPPTRQQQEAACRAGADTAARRLVERKADRACEKR